MIEAIGLTKRMPVGGGRASILDAVDLTVARGESVAVVGRSGSGKSTLLSLLALFDRPDSGTYRLDGSEVTGATERVAGRIRSDVLGFVFQRFFLMKQLTAAQNVELPLLNGRSGIRARRRRSLVDDALASVGLADLGGRRPSELSGGEQQRVAIARALVRGPRVVLADEPTGALDPATGAGIIELLTSIAKRGTAVVMVTHDHDYAARLDRVVHLTEGRVACP